MRNLTMKRLIRLNKTKTWTKIQIWMQTIFGTLRLENLKNLLICRNHCSTFINCSSNYQTLKSRTFYISCCNASMCWPCMVTHYPMRHEIIVDSSFGVKRIHSSKSKVAKAVSITKFCTKTITMLKSLQFMEFMQC